MHTLIQNKRPELSIIVPYYNLRRALPRLLDSIAGQNMRDTVELVLVDDCSAEPCDDILAKYADDIHINLIRNTQRRHLKMARLTGIAAAKADIVCFIDADGCLFGTEELQKHLRMMQQTNADILHFSAIRSIAGKCENQKWDWGEPLAKKLQGNAILWQFLSQKRSWVVWNKLYKKQLWNTIYEFAKNSEVFYDTEDIYFSILLFFHAKKYIGISNIGYEFDAANIKPNRHNNVVKIFWTYSYIYHEILPYLEMNGASNEMLAMARCFLFYRVSRQLERIKKSIIAYGGEHKGRERVLNELLSYGTEDHIAEFLLWVVIFKNFGSQKPVRKNFAERIVLTLARRLRPFLPKGL